MQLAYRERSMTCNLLFLADGSHQKHGEYIYALYCTKIHVTFHGASLKRAPPADCLLRCSLLYLGEMINAKYPLLAVMRN
jgi:hypothetical protein